MTERACRDCPLRPLPLFMAHSDNELALAQSLKKREQQLEAGAPLIDEGQVHAPLFMLLSGWAFRIKTLSDGRRQILNSGPCTASNRRWASTSPWLTARKESVVDETLLSVGRRSAEERIATLLVLLFKRAAALQTDKGAGGVPFPLTQQHVADALGLSLVHTKKTMRKLERRGLPALVDGRLHLRDVKALVRLADVYGDGQPPPRPLV